MAKPLRGECEVELAGEKFTLRLGLGELEELDNATGMGTLELARSLSSPGAKISHARAVLGQSLSGEKEGKKLPPPQVGRIIERAGYFETIRAAVSVLTAVLTDPNEGNAVAPGEAEKTSRTGA